MHPTTVDAATPRAVRAFISQVMDVYLADIHAMLRLPRPEVNITEGCNFSIVAVLMNVISGVSVVLYEPPANRASDRQTVHGNRKRVLSLGHRAGGGANAFRYQNAADSSQNNLAFLTSVRTAIRSWEHS